MTESEKPYNKILADGKITIPPSPFLNKIRYGTGMELSRSRGALITPWAYKMLSKRVKPNKDSKKAEANILLRISHPNIAGFRMSSKHSKIQYLAMAGSAQFLGELIENKIRANYEQFLPKQIVKVAADIASALDYLHTNVQILHGDIKSYNILVKGNFEICKLCDFTVTLPLDRNGVLDKKKAGQSAYYAGTEAWYAPEVIHGGEISCKTDIWALGLTLFEMLALIPPHSMPGCTCGQSTDDNDSLGDSLNDNDVDSDIDVDDRLDNVGEYFYGRYGTRPAIPINVSEKQFMHSLTLFYWCTETEPAKRLTAQHMCAAARDMLDHLSYGVWFPHLNHGERLCLKS